MRTRLAYLFSISWIVAGLTTTASAVPIQWSSSSGGNNHWYEIIRNNNLDWQGAVDSSSSSYYLGMQGHLVTITSQGEQDFLSTNSFLGASINLYGDLIWLGGYQTQDITVTHFNDITFFDVNSGEWEAFGTGNYRAEAAAADWNWITGEAWSYEFWGSSQPNNGGTWIGPHIFQDTLSMRRDIFMDQAYWDDVAEGAYAGGTALRAYIVEYEASAPVPEPATMILFGTGLASLVGITRRKKRD